MTEVIDGLSDARAAFVAFEKAIGRPVARHHLSEALDSILNIIEDFSASDKQKTIARNLALSYRRKLLGRVREIVEDRGTHDFETYEYWLEMITAFSDANLDEGEEVRKWRLKVFEREVGTLPAAERKELFDKLL